MRAVVGRWAAARLLRPVDAASLGVFRIVFGLGVAVDAWRYLGYGWVREYYVEPQLNFTYLHLGFVRPWPEPWIYLHFWALSGVALLCAAGLWYRVTSVLLLLGYAYVFLLEQAVYMNHHYLMVLLALLLACMPAEQAYSLDRRRRPGPRSTVPFWAVWLLRVQLFLVYFYGGIAKIDPDWLRGEPVYGSILERAAEPGSLAALLPAAPLAYAICYGGLLIDLAVPLLLAVRRTVPIGFAIAFVFHALNAVFLDIGVFSYLMVGALTIFYAPDWPRRGLREILRPVPPSVRAAPPARRGTLALALVHVYVLVQLVVPLRHWLYPGHVSWTEEGHRFSWRMKLRAKRSRLSVVAEDPASGRTWIVDPAEHLTDRQLRTLGTFPDVLLQYVHFVRRRIEEQGVPNPILRVDWQCSLNGRPYRPLADPTVDLGRIERSWRPAAWILPLDPSGDESG